VSAALLGLLLAAGCQSQPAKESEKEVIPAPNRIEAPADAWMAETLDQLAPVLPTHSTHVPRPLEETADIRRTLATLSQVVDSRTSDPQTPWAIGHGILARGPNLKLSNGQNGVDWLFSQYAEELPAGGHTYIQFPESQGKIRVEPHSDLVLKGLTEVGVDPDRIVMVQGHPHPIADLWRGSLVRTFLVPTRNHSRYASPDDIAWSLQGLTAWAPPHLAWVALDGTPMNLDDLTDYTAAVLFQETRFMATTMAAGQPFERKGQGIFRYTCGGAHLLQGVAFAVLHGFGSAPARQVIDEQVPMMFYRYPIELDIYRKAEAALPTQADKIVVQRMKFSGHWLETMSKLAAMGVYTPDDAQLKVLATAATELGAAATDLKDRGLLDDLDAVRARDEQQYLDIVGDSAHGIRGLELALGRGEVRW